MDYNPILCYLFLFKFSQFWPLGALSVDSYAFLTYYCYFMHVYVCFVSTFVCYTFLLPITTKCSRLILYILCLSLEISHFTNYGSLNWWMLLETKIWVLSVLALLAHDCFQAPLNWQYKEIFVCMNIIICIHLYLYYDIYRFILISLALMDYHMNHSSFLLCLLLTSHSNSEKPVSCLLHPFK